MFSGEWDRPYRSPVHIEAVEPRAEGVFELSLLNIFYPAGVQRMTYLLRPLRWEKTYLAAEQLENRIPRDRLVIIEKLDCRWMEENVPRRNGDVLTLFDAAGEPIEDEFLRLVASVF